MCLDCLGRLIVGLEKRLPCIVLGVLSVLSLMLISACTNVPSAKVTITPVSSDLKNTYTFSAIPGKPDAAQRQVQARIVTSSASAQSKTVPATGVKQTDAAQAMGTVTFYNGSITVQTVASGTVLTGSDGVAIITDALAIIPAAIPPAYGFVSVPAHALQPGISGNIAALDINHTCCIAGNFVFVKNLAAFSGGQDQQNYTVVQQSDIDGAVHAVEPSLMDSAQTDLQKQIDPKKEQLARPGSCMPKVMTDHQVGDRAANVTVNVAVTCIGEVYDQQAALRMAANLLNSEAKTTLSADYALAGNIQTRVTQATVVDTKQGVIALLVSAEGVWVYQISDTQKQDMVTMIAGKSKQDALDVLLKQVGVSKADIQVSGSDGATLPLDTSQIALTIQRIQR